MRQYDLTIQDVMRLRKALPEHMEPARERLADLCAEWDQSARVGTMRMSNVEGLATMTITFRLPFEEGVDLAPENLDDLYVVDYKEDCERLREILVNADLVPPHYPLRHIYLFWSDYSESFSAGWLTLTVINPDTLPYHFKTWKEENGLT